MKKVYILFLLSVIVYVGAQAQSIEKGYHGFVEGGYSINTGATLGLDWPEINTIHGYQATPSFFIGAGVGFHSMPEKEEGFIGNGTPMWKRESSMEIPLFADFRWTMFNKRTTPLLDLRLGHCLTNGGGTYGSLGAGCRISLKNQKAIYILAAFTIHEIQFQEAYMVTTKYSYYWYYRDQNYKEEQRAISLKVGFEF
jgi:hypothetical protein